MRRRAVCVGIVSGLLLLSGMTSTTNAEEVVGKKNESQTIETTNIEEAKEPTVSSDANRQAEKPSKTTVTPSTPKIVSQWNLENNEWYYYGTEGKKTDKHLDRKSLCKKQWC